MKEFFILPFVIFISSQGFSQTAAELTPQGKMARKILLENGIKTACFSATQTPQGLVISSRTETNIPVNYLFTNDKQFQKMEQLDRYIVFGYSPLKNELLVNKYAIDPNGDSMCHEIFTYHLNSKQFKRQCDFGWIYGEPHYTNRYDSIVVIVNEKNSDGIGSHYGTRIVKVR